jgi:hypothetical protein
MNDTTSTRRQLAAKGQYHIASLVAQGDEVASANQHEHAANDSTSPVEVDVVVPHVEAEIMLTEFDGLCTAVRGRIEHLRDTMVSETLGIAADLLAAKRAYEKATGTGHGKRNPERVPAFVDVAAAKVGLSAAWVEKYVRLAVRLEDDVETTKQLREMTDVSFRLVLALADEKDTARRLLAIEAHRRGGGARAMKQALEGHPLARVIGLFTHAETSPFPNLPPTTPVSAQLIEQFPELKPYETIGDVVEAIRQPAARTKSPRSVPAPVPPFEPQGSVVPDPSAPPAPTTVEVAHAVEVVTAKGGGTASLAILPASTPRGRSTIVVAPKIALGIDAVVKLVARAMDLGLDLTAPGTELLTLIDVGLDERERNIASEKEVYEMAMALGDSADEA